MYSDLDPCDTEKLTKVDLAMNIRRVGELSSGAELEKGRGWWFTFAEIPGDRVGQTTWAHWTLGMTHDIQHAHPASGFQCFLGRLFVAKSRKLIIIKLAL